MSVPEEIQNETQSEQPIAEQPMDLATAVGQLRLMVCGLAVGLIVVSLALSGFIFKQTRDLSAATNNRQHQIAELQVARKPTLSLLNELAKYSVGKPELTALFIKHGIQITPPTGAAPQH
jgi:hypothetical protein